MMDMSGMTTSMSMGSATTTAMSMATTTASSMDMDSSMSMSMSDMSMTFFTSFKTPLYSDAWTPTSKGIYAGTCIFLIALSVILRVLLAVRPSFCIWLHGVRPGSDLDLIEHTGKHVSGVHQIAADLGSRWSRWRVNSAASLATFDMVIAGVSYLLMLAVMTMNVGYFMSVLAGVWLGTFIMGSVASDSAGNH